jgi:hypothetical protein
MYCLLENDNIVAGPFDWNARRFTLELLEEYGIKSDLPANSNNQSFEINETLKLLPVNSVVHKEYDTRTQQLVGPVPVVADGLKLTYTIADRDIDVVKAELVQELAANRYNYEVKGVEVSLGATTILVPTDRESRNTLLQCLALSVFDKSWKFGSSWVVLSSSDLKTVVDAILAHVQSAFDWEQAKLVELADISLLEDLAVFDVVKAS